VAIAPHPEDFPKLLDQMGAYMRKPYDWSADVKKLTVPVMLNSRDLLLVEGHLAPDLPLPFTPARLSSALLKCPRSRSSIYSQAEITTNTKPIK